MMVRAIVTVAANNEDEIISVDGVPVFCGAPLDSDDLKETLDCFHVSEVEWSPWVGASGMHSELPAGVYPVSQFLDWVRSQEMVLRATERFLL